MTKRAASRFGDKCRGDQVLPWLTHIAMPPYSGPLTQSPYGYTPTESVCILFFTLFGISSCKSRNFGVDPAFNSHFCHLWRVSTDSLHLLRPPQGRVDDCSDQAHNLADSLQSALGVPVTRRGENERWSGTSRLQNNGGSMLHSDYLDL